MFAPVYIFCSFSAVIYNINSYIRTLAIVTYNVFDCCLSQINLEKEKAADDIVDPNAYRYVESLLKRANFQSQNI